MIKDIVLKFGRADGLAPETITGMPITVFVGPNNSGKSKILTEINQFCSSGNKNTNNVIIDSIDLAPFEDKEIDKIINNVTLKPNPGEAVQLDHIFVGKGGARNQVPLPQLKQALLTPNAQPTHTCQWFLAYNTLILNGSNRINLVNEQPGGNLQQHAQSSFQTLFRGENWVE